MSLLKKVEQGKKHNVVKMASGLPAGHLCCPLCGNKDEFLEQSLNVTMNVFYSQNRDGSFTRKHDDTEIMGETLLLCAICGSDMSQYHGHLTEMTF